MNIGIGMNDEGRKMSSEETTDHALVDNAHALHLDGGHIAALVVTPDGATWPWLLDVADNPLDIAGGCACRACVPHEQTGRLPAAIRERVTPVPRCGATKRNGHPCRSPVPTDGTCCGHHRQAATTTGVLW